MTSVVDQLDDFLIDQLVIKKSVSGDMSFAPSNNPTHLALLKKKKFKQSFIDVIM
jgi:hypothetical protein